MGIPLLCDFWTQLDRARSISGYFPFTRFTGDALRSSVQRYFSLFRKTFDTVLEMTC